LAAIPIGEAGDRREHQRYELVESLRELRIRTTSYLDGRLRSLRDKRIGFFAVVRDGKRWRLQRH